MIYCIIVWLRLYDKYNEISHIIDLYYLYYIIILLISYILLYYLYYIIILYLYYICCDWTERNGTASQRRNPDLVKSLNANCNNAFLLSRSFSVFGQVVAPWWCFLSLFSTPCKFMAAARFFFAATFRRIVFRTSANFLAGNFFPTSLFKVGKLRLEIKVPLNGNLWEIAIVPSELRLQ